MKLLVAVCLLLPGLSFSQKKGIEKGKPGIILSSGVVIGQSAVKPLYQATGGVSHDSYFAGIGAGYDDYRFRTIPLFADGRINFGYKKVGFIYLQAGYNFPVNYQSEEEFSKVKDRLKGGAYLDGGIGFRLWPGRWSRVLLSAGYSRKYMVQEKAYAYPCGLNPCSEPVTEYTYRYSFGRIVVKAGWEIGR